MIYVSMWTATSLKRESLTHQRLLSVEVIGHAFNFVVESLNLAEHDRQVLKHQATRSVWVLSRKLCQIVTDAASNVYDERSIILRLGALDQPLLNREEVCIHPAGSALAVATHVMVELRSVRRVRLKIREEVKLGVVRVLVRTVFRIARLGIASLCCKKVEF